MNYDIDFAYDFAQNRVALLTEFRAGLALKRPLSFITITGIDDGVGPPPLRDRFGWIRRSMRRVPSPGYTRQTLGGQEAERDYRRGLKR